MHCNKELLSISVYCPVHAGSGSRGICAMGDEAGGLGARFQMLSVRSTPMAARALLLVDAGPRRRVVDVADSALLAVARIADNVGDLRRESARSETLRPPDVT